MADTPLFSQEDDLRTENAVHTTYAKLQHIGDTDGVSAMLAEAIGISWAVAHLFKTLGLKEVHRKLRKDTADFIGGKSAGKNVGG